MMSDVEKELREELKDFPGSARILCRLLGDTSIIHSWQYTGVFILPTHILHYLEQIKIIPGISCEYTNRIILALFCATQNFAPIFRTIDKQSISKHLFEELLN